jgi:glucans biosynthesis protein
MEHVHVHTGGQAIVGSVSQSGGGRDNDENRGQPHAPENAGAITFAPGTTLPSADEARDAMPVASGRRCRMNGGAAGSGAPKGKRNGKYRHGGFTTEAIDERRRLASLIRDSRDFLSRLR